MMVSGPCSRIIYVEIFSGYNNKQLTISQITHTEFQQAKMRPHNAVEIQ